MPISSVQSQMAKVMPTETPVEDIANSKAMTEQQKVTEMTRQFEAMLVRQILSQAQKSALKSNLVPDAGISNDIYKDMMVNNLAETISSSRTIGIAQELEKQVTHRVHGAPVKTENAISAVEPPKNSASPILTKAPRL